MNVFDELITELKQENLLEDTVLDPSSDPADDIEATQVPNREFDPAAVIAASKPKRREQEDDLGDVNAAVPSEQVTRNDAVEDAPVQDKPKKNGSEFFKKRAVAEVSALQMVEHVLTGVEREYMKVKPNVFDDFQAKMALNRFLQVADGPADTEEHKAAEFALMSETEAWCSALADRDRNIYVSSLRQYCENTKPALSSQALLSLCRFYRNLPYSEAVRSKFDFLITRLFSRPAPQDQRVCLFKRDEAIGHLNTLYRDWSSVALYSADDDASDVMLTALSFDDLAKESEDAHSFDQLIESDFFGRLRMFKESISELFFAPQVAISAIESNVRIGNAYVKLIAAERQKMDADSIQAKYVDFDHESLSDATARTLGLVELLRSPAFDPQVAGAEVDPESGPLAAEPRPERPESNRERVPYVREQEDGTFVSRMMANALSVNKWFLAVAIVLISASIGVYIWANYVVDDTASTVGIKTVSDTPLFREYLKTAKISNETLHGLMLPSWDTLPKDRRQEYVQKLLAAGTEQGYKQVDLTKADGKPAAYASATRLEIQMP
jgi:hypothetical protein